MSEHTDGFRFAIHRAALSLPHPDVHGETRISVAVLSHTSRCPKNGTQEPATERPD